jgi:hypothetical protein
LHSWNSFNKSHFSIYIHMCIIFSQYSPSHPLSLYLPLPLVPTPQTGVVLPSCSPFLFKNEDSYTGSFFVTFPYIYIHVYICMYVYVHICVYYNPNWLIPSIFLLSTLVPFLLWFQ